jgi:hypothetical protein
MSDLRQRILDAVATGDVIKTTPLYETVNMLKKFFKQKYNSNLINEYEDLIIELSEVNSDFFWNQIYSKLNHGLLKKYKQEELCKIEYNIADKIFIEKQLGERIVVDFIGKIELPKLKVQEEGHIFLTNLGIFVISWRSKVSMP